MRANPFLANHMTRLPSSKTYSFTSRPTEKPTSPGQSQKVQLSISTWLVLKWVATVFVLAGTVQFTGQHSTDLAAIIHCYCTQQTCLMMSVSVVHVLKLTSGFVSLSPNILSDSSNQISSTSGDSHAPCPPWSRHGTFFGLMGIRDSVYNGHIMVC